MLNKILEFLKAQNAPADLLQFAEKELKQVNVDTVKAFLETDEAGKTFLKSHTDSYTSKALATFKEKTMPGLIEEEIAKRNPPETPEQKEARQLKSDFAKLQSELKRKDLAGKLTQKLIADKMPVELVDFLIGEDEDTSLANYSKVKTVYDGAISEAVKAQFSANGRTPGTSNTPPPPEYDKMSDDQYFATRIKNSK